MFVLLSVRLLRSSRIPKDCLLRWQKQMEALRNTAVPPSPSPWPAHTSPQPDVWLVLRKSQPWKTNVGSRLGKEVP